MVKTSKPAVVERLWPESTIVCIASGPSLTREDVDFCRDRARVIVVNDNYKLAPWADVLFAPDGYWWQHKDHKAAHAFAGLKFGIGPRCGDGVITLKYRGSQGLEEDPTGLRGRNSGHHAVNLAVHLGARSIVLLGYDMQETDRKTHWFGHHPSGIRETNPALFIEWRQHAATLLKPLAARGISIVNCSRQTALQCFSRQLLADVLPDRLEAAS